MTMLLTPQDLYPTQIAGVNHVLQHPQCMLWNKMGKGKTVTTATALSVRINRLEVYGVLVVAPLRVCQTVWPKEIKKWTHLQHLTTNLVWDKTILGRQRNIRTRANIYIINYDSLRWFCDEAIHIWINNGLSLPFNSIVFDEVTMVKDYESLRSRSIQRILQYIPYRIGLTGTPASNGYKDLFGQYFVVDSGERLGVDISAFHKQYFNIGGSQNRKLELEDTAEERIKKRIGDITFMVSDDSEDNLPPFIFNPIEIPLDQKTLKSYKKLEKEFFLELDSGVEIEVKNKLSLYNKCLQAANGALYIETGNPEFEILHNKKLDALEEIVESANSPVLVLYGFIHDFKRIKKRFKDVEFFYSGMSESEAVALEEKWNKGDIPILVGHPKSMGHGLNLQYGGSTIVWYGLNWSLELFEQAIYRLRRPGQKNSVVVHMLMAQETLDYVVYDALNHKAKTQDDLRNTINKYRTGDLEIDSFHNDW